MNSSGSPRLAELSALVERTVLSSPITDIHTHLYDPSFGPLLLWGIDEQLTYHYLVAETFRHLELPYDAYWRLSTTEKADLVWRSLFLERSPLSEAARGVITSLHRLGIDPRAQDLPALRRWFAQWKTDDFISRCMEVAGVERIYMTNSPFDDLERPIWEGGFRRDPRFLAALRIDPLLVQWSSAAAKLREWGYIDNCALDRSSFDGCRRFLGDWAQRIDAQYVMVSLPPDFQFPGPGETASAIENVVLPFCRESGLPFALMLGVKRAVNPALQLAGDGVGRSDLSALQNLCAANPDVKFLVTVLSRENQHELCVLARKFRNLHVFGCWWFTNVPSVIEEMSRVRLELLGPSFTPQHSDARVMDQILYKWEHSRQLLARVLVDHYGRLAEAGWWPTGEEVQRDVRALFGGAFGLFCRR